jgi:hypothetical protein
MRSTEVKTPRATLDDDLILEMLRGWNAGRGVFAATFAVDEALVRYPRSDGMFDGQRCVCTRECPLACDGKKCGCEARTREWFDAGLAM